MLMDQLQVTVLKLKEGRESCVRPAAGGRGGAGSDALPGTTHTGATHSKHRINSEKGMGHE